MKKIIEKGEKKINFGIEFSDVDFFPNFPWPAWPPLKKEMNSAATVRKKICFSISFIENFIRQFSYSIYLLGAPFCCEIVESPSGTVSVATAAGEGLNQVILGSTAYFYVNPHSSNHGVIETRVIGTSIMLLTTHLNRLSHQFCTFCQGAREISYESNSCENLSNTRCDFIRFLKKINIIRLCTSTRTYSDLIKRPCSKTGRVRVRVRVYVMYSYVGTALSSYVTEKLTGI